MITFLAGVALGFAGGAVVTYIAVKKGWIKQAATAVSDVANKL